MYIGEIFDPHFRLKVAQSSVERIAKNCGVDATIEMDNCNNIVLFYSGFNKNFETQLKKNFNLVVCTERPEVPAEWHYREWDQTHHASEFVTLSYLKIIL